MDNNYCLYKNVIVEVDIMTFKLPRPIDFFEIVVERVIITFIVVVCTYDSFVLVLFKVV